ncbi:MAG: TraB/GumN family protein [Pseudoxanthomonas sp.]
MRQRLRACALALLLCVAASVQGGPAALVRIAAASPTAARPQPAGAAPPVPLLWKVSDGRRSLYLLGSFHALRAEDYPLSADVQAAFDDAESLLFEVPPAQMQSPQLAADMLAAGTLAQGQRLQDVLPAATWAGVQAWAARNGLQPAQLQPFKPWLVALTIAQREMVRQGLDPKLGLDLHFMQQGQQAGKAEAGLETAKDQIDLLDGMSADEQAQFLAETLDDASAEGQHQGEQLHAAWRAGDLRSLRDGMAEQMKRDYPALYRRIDVERNRRWLPELEARLHAPGGHDTLAVVGALHLLGGDGVVEQLRAKGYRVERICSACRHAAQP